MMITKWMNLLLLIPYCGALYMEGELRTLNDWAFMARFCFLSDVGELRFEVDYPKSFAVQNLILYYDEPDQWDAVYPLDTAPLQTCLQKESVLRPENHQVINLTTEFVWSGCLLQAMDEVSDADWLVTYDTDQKYSCDSKRSFRSIRDRWWFVVLDNCQSINGLVARYRLTMTNGDTFFRRHFSADQFGILESYLAYSFWYLVLNLMVYRTSGIAETDLVIFGCYMVIASLTYVVAGILRGKQLLHTTYKMFIVAVVLYFVSLCCFIIYYFDYAADGRAAPFWKITARVLQAASDAVFLLMLILMAKGYTITRGRISHSGSIKITVLMALYCMVYTGLFIYEAVVFDPGEVLYFYESPAGICLVFLRGLTWLYFIYAIFFTLKHYPEKAAFYVPFFFAYTLWFLVMPVMILVAAFLMPKWWREKAMNAIELFIALVAHTGFLILTRPSAANTNFPYHVRTSQIGCALDTDLDGTLQSNVDGFVHHGNNGNVIEAERRATNFDELFTVGYSANRQSATLNKPANGNVQTPRPTNNNNRDPHISSIFQVGGHSQNGNNNTNR